MSPVTDPVKDASSARLALAFRADEIALFGADGWIASAPLNAPDFNMRMAAAASIGAERTGRSPPEADLILPSEQVLTLSLNAAPGDHDAALAEARA